MRQTATIVAMLLASPLLQAQLPSEWSHWEYAASIDAAPTDAARFVAVTVPPEVTGAAAPAWADLRVLDADGREVPYALRSTQAAVEEAWRQTRVLEPGVARDLFTQAVVDTGAAARIHNAARLRFETPDDFLGWVEIAVSDDAREWRVVRERAPVFRLRAEGMGESLRVSYPDTIARYVRFRVLDGSRPYRLDGVETAFETETRTELVQAGTTFAEGEGKPEQSVWIGRGAAVPVAALRFGTSQALFDRSVSVETSADGREWRQLVSGRISRVVEQGQSRATLDVSVTQTPASFWRVTIDNRNDPPLPDFTITALTIPRRVVFMQQPGGRYRLIYGNRKARAPQYEIGRLASAATLDAAAPTTLGAPERNATYADPAPWTERHPVILWSGVLILIVLLGGLAFQTMKRA